MYRQIDLLFGFIVGAGLALVTRKADLNLVAIAVGIGFGIFVGGIGMAWAFHWLRKERGEQ
jgi:hypothetical protein